MKSKKYAKGLIENAPDYAGYTVKLGRVTRVADSLTVDEAASINLKSVVDNPPTPPEGFYEAPTGWVESDTAITRTYEEVAIEPTPRRFNKYSLVEKLSEKGYFDAFIAIIDENRLTKELWSAAQTLEEDDDTFKAVVAKAKEKLGVTDEQVEAFLATVEEA